MKVFCLSNIFVLKLGDEMTKLCWSDEFWMLKKGGPCVEVSGSRNENSHTVIPSFFGASKSDSAVASLNGKQPKAQATPIAWASGVVSDGRPNMPSVSEINQQDFLKRLNG